MLPSFGIGAAILLGFAILYLVGTMQLSTLLERWLQDDIAAAKYWGPAWGAWTIIVSLAFGLFSLTDWAHPVSKLGPLISGLGLLAGLMISLTRFKPNED